LVDLVKVDYITKMDESQKEIFLDFIFEVNLRRLRGCRVEDAVNINASQ